MNSPGIPSLKIFAPMVVNLKKTDFPIDAWVFDLDNTLYPASCDLFSQVDARMGAFIAMTLKLDDAAARQLQKSYFLKHGTTLRGLMNEHSIAPDEFLEFVHDIDFSKVEAAPVMAAALARLPGRKFIFTNASQSYSTRILTRIGIENHFDGIFDIEKAGFAPKPDPATYGRMLAYFSIDPGSAIMIEDIARNLKPAADLGMKTAWVPTDQSWSREGACDMKFDYVIDDLGIWLTEMADKITDKKI